MDSLFLTNLTSPPLLFFFLGAAAAFVRSDLEIPTQIAKFLSLYLLFSIGFKGGVALAESDLGLTVARDLLAALVERCGGQAEQGPVLPDDPARIAADSASSSLRRASSKMSASFFRACGGFRLTNRSNAIGEPIVRPRFQPERISTRSVSRLELESELCPGRRRSSSAWITQWRTNSRSKTVS